MLTGPNVENHIRAASDLYKLVNRVVNSITAKCMSCWKEPDLYRDGSIALFASRAPSTGHRERYSIQLAYDLPGVSFVKDLITDYYGYRWISGRVSRWYVPPRMTVIEMQHLRALPQGQSTLAVLEICTVVRSASGATSCMGTAEIHQ